MKADGQAEQHRLLAMIETAQQAGRSEDEIVALVESAVQEDVAEKSGSTLKRAA
jgi:hypothetical protein